MLPRLAISLHRLACRIDPLPALVLQSGYPAKFCAQLEGHGIKIPAITVYPLTYADECELVRLEQAAGHVRKLASVPK